MRLTDLLSFRPHCALALSLCLATGTVAAAGSASPGPAAAAAAAPEAASCWTISGPFADGKETYFEAKNECDEPRHCKVWVNGHEPPYMIHLSSGTSGRIDVGPGEPDDKYTQDCAPVGLYGDHQG